MKRFAVLGALLRGTFACTSDEDCELNGLCEKMSFVKGDLVSKRCECDDGWTGSTCGVLDLVPAPADAGLRQNDWSTWCGSVARDPDSGEYNMFSSEMGNHAGLEVWTKHSRIIRATSKTGVGPYTPVNISGDKEIVVKEEAHNPMAIQAPDGTFLLYDSYAGQGFRCVEPGPGLFYYHTAPSLQGPWTLRTMNITYECKSCNLTPTPLFHPNGTFYIMFHCDRDASHSACDLVMHRGDSWKGPLEAVNRRVWDQSQAPGHTEDPFLWLDARGNWHTILHNGPHGVHIFSRDGLEFNVAKGNQAPWPYTTNVSTTEGTVQVSRRERPSIIFEGGAPKLLVTSMMPKSGRTFTHVQEVVSKTKRALV